MNGEKYVTPMLGPGQTFARHHDGNAKERRRSGIKKRALNGLGERTSEMCKEETEMTRRERDPSNAVYQPKQ